MHVLSPLFRPSHMYTGVELSAIRLGLAMVAASRGYKLVVAMPRLQGNHERYLLMRGMTLCTAIFLTSDAWYGICALSEMLCAALGADVRLCEPELKTKGILDLAEQIVR